MLLKLLRLTSLIGFMICVIGAIGCTPMMYDHDLVGKVIDGKSNEPIQGAVVLGYWEKWHAAVAGRMTNFYDAKETVTDENGNFKLEGKGLRVLSNITEAGAFIIKDPYIPGSIYYDKLERNNGVVKLYKMPDKQLINFYGTSVTTNIPSSKCKLYSTEEELLIERAIQVRKKARRGKR